LDSLRLSASGLLFSAAYLPLQSFLSPPLTPSHSSESRDMNPFRFLQYCGVVFRVPCRPPSLTSAPALTVHFRRGMTCSARLIAMMTYDIRFERLLGAAPSFSYGTPAALFSRAQPVLFPLPRFFSRYRVPVCFFPLTVPFLYA